MEDLPVIRRCGYRNCSNIVEGKLNKKFCCENHKKMEFTYRKRRNGFIDKAIQFNKKIVDQYKELVDIIKKNN